MIQRLRNSAAFRLKMARFGIFYLRSSSFSLKSLRIAGRRVSPSYPSGEEAVLEHELGKILFQDCYRLSRMHGPVRTVLDIGANVGLFSVAARHFFPASTIHAYEPNPELEACLRSNCESLNIRYFLSGVALISGVGSLDFRENSLHTVLAPATDGEIPLTGFGAAIDRLGGQVDVLKLDCEGAEWSLLEDAKPWSKVRHLTMEYHLWAKPNSTTDDLVRRLDQLGFECVALEPSTNGPFGMLQATRKVSERNSHGV